MEVFNQYFQEIKKEYKRGECTELTHRPAIKQFIETINSHLELSGENKKIKGIGRPDFVCFKKKIKIGYIETKDLFDISSEQGLKKIITSPQLIKYQNEAIPNLILTDYLRFILIRNKETRFDITLFTKEDLDKGKFTISEQLVKQFNQLIESFLDYNLPTIKTPSDLANQLSKRAVLLRELVKEQLQEDLENVKNNQETSPIYEFYEAFKELIKDAKPDDCVDAYAQTITYGLFLSKIGSHDGLNRDSAATYIPSSIKIIKKIFMNIAGDDLPSNCSWIVDEIIDILNAADLQKILSEFVFEGKHYKDPFIHFYEDFLKEYDPEKRKHLGVYYTPEPVVSFITNSINEILKKDFGKTTGFADDSVYVLDFATGTGTFLANAFVLALKEIRNAGLTGIESSKIENHLLKHFYGFEILVSPYVIAHLKLGLLLKQEGHEIHGDERVRVYLTNTLDPQETIHDLRGFFKELSHETLMANKIKLETPILVVMGNPPYSVSSSNKSEWITKLMRDYKEDLNERNIQPLDDDYIKFIRFAQWKIEQNKEGIVGIITNNRYLDGVIHRQMRKELIKTFDKIYILNLHGSSKITTHKDDKNVFDIQQGVTIALFIKNNKKTKNEVYYSELFGSREHKYTRLYELKLKDIRWINITPKKPYYFLIERNDVGERKYSKYFSINQIFKISSVGVKTHRDDFIVTDSSKELINNLTKLKQQEIDEEFRKKLNCSKEEEKKFIQTLKNYPDLSVKIRDYAYRPFDIKKIFYDKVLITRHRDKVMHVFAKTNIGIASTRLLSGDYYSHIFCTENISDICLVSTKTSESAYIFPLYSYESKNETQTNLISKEIPIKILKESNLSGEFLKFISEKYPNKEISPEEILGYIYAVLHSPTYRQKYQAFLKIDFPRIPFVKDYTKFVKLSKLGSELIELHLMKKQFSKNIAKFEVSGSNEVNYVKYKDKKISINDKQYFDNIPEDVWNFHIGGYQVLDKWLKSRKGRKLTHTEIETYIPIVNILSETIRIMNEIDKIKI